MTTYATLTAKVTEAVNDSSLELSQYMPTAVALAERMIFNHVAQLECYKTELDYNYDISAQQGMPPSFTITSNLGDLEIIRSVAYRIQSADPYTALERRTDDFLDYWQTEGDDQLPLFYNVDSRTESAVKIRFAPYSTTATYQFQIKGYGLVDQLDATNTASTSWISVNAFDVLLYATLIHVALFLKKDPSPYQAGFESGLTQLGLKMQIQVNTETDKGIE